MKYEAGDNIILWRNQANLNEGGVLIQEDNGALAMWLAKGQYYILVEQIIDFLINSW